MIYVNKQLDGQTEAVVNEKNFPWLIRKTENGFVKTSDFVCKVVGKDICVQTLYSSGVDILDNITKELLRYENELYDRLILLFEQIDLTYEQLGIIERHLNDEVEPKNKMKTATYKHNDQSIVFDDFTVDNDFDTVWVEMCPDCLGKYHSILQKHFPTGSVTISDCGEAQGTCSVCGCNNEAECYVDFLKSEIEIKE